MRGSDENTARIARAIRLGGPPIKFVLAEATDFGITWRTLQSRRLPPPRLQTLQNRRVNNHFEKGNMDWREYERSPSNSAGARVRLWEYEPRQYTQSPCADCRRCAAPSGLFSQWSQNHRRADDCGGFASNVSAAPAHGNADMSGLDCRRIVYAITGHG